MPTTGVSSSALRPALMSQAYGLLALSLVLTIVGVMAGATVALPLVTSGWIFALLIAELVLVWTAPDWSRNAPLNYVLFALFPLFSGLVVTPFIMMVLAEYANGASILLNALIATTLLTGAAAVYARSTPKDLASTMGRALLHALIGLIIFGLLQIFIPALQGQAVEMLASGAGIVIFALFLAVDMQRLLRRGDLHSPFLLALSLYLDIFNLFLYVVRFMLAVSGRRR